MCTCAHTHKQDKVKTSDTKRQQTRKKEKQDKKQETKYLQNSQTTRTKPMKGHYNYHLSIITLNKNRLLL